MTVYAVKNKAESIDLAMVNSQFNKFTYFSYKHTISSQRMVAINSNEMINVKGRLEILYNVHLKDKILKD